MDTPVSVTDIAGEPDWVFVESIVTDLKRRVAPHIFESSHEARDFLDGRR